MPSVLPDAIRLHGIFILLKSPGRSNGKVIIVKIIENLKTGAQNRKKEITAIYYACQNPETGLLPKIIILFTLGYALSPIDLIPDFIPVIGHLDDLIIIPLLIALSIKLIPEDVMKKSIERAEKEPFEFKKNRYFALLFIMIWVIIFTVIILSIVRLFT